MHTSPGRSWEDFVRELTESVKPEALSLCFLRGLRLILRPPPLIVKHAGNERPLFHDWDNDELPEEGEMEAGLDETEGNAHEE